MRRGHSAADLNKDTMWRLSRPLPWASAYDDRVYANTAGDSSGGGGGGGGGGGSGGGANSSSSRRAALRGFASDSGSTPRTRSSRYARRSDNTIVRSSSSGSLSHLGSGDPRGHGMRKSMSAAPVSQAGGGGPRSSSLGPGAGHSGAYHRHSGVGASAGVGSGGGSGSGSGSGSGAGAGSGSGSGVGGASDRSLLRRRHGRGHHHDTAGGAGTGRASRSGGRRTAGSGTGPGGGGAAGLPNVPSSNARLALVPRMFTASFNGESASPGPPKPGFYVMRKKPPGTALASPVTGPSSSSSSSSRPVTSAASPVRLPTGLSERDFGVLAQPGTYASVSRRSRSAAAAMGGGSGVGGAMMLSPGSATPTHHDGPLGGVPLVTSPSLSPPLSPRTAAFLMEMEQSQRLGHVHGAGLATRGPLSPPLRSRQFVFGDGMPAAGMVVATAGGGVMSQQGRGGALPVGSDHWNDSEVSEYVMRHKLSEFGSRARHSR